MALTKRAACASTVKPAHKSGVTDKELTSQHVVTESVHENAYGEVGARGRK